MITLLSAVASLLSFRVRSRASLELELVALRHQVTVLRRQRPGQPRLFSTDRLLWVWLYRIWPQVLNTMVLVKPATVVQWHRKGFRLYWRRRSRHLGRRRVSREIRDLIRQMSLANPPSLGRAPHPRRAAQARHRGQPGHGWQIPAVAAQSLLPDLALVSAQSHA
jgi:putative transposase